MKTMKKKITVAVTVALLAFPLGTTVTLADTVNPTTTTTTMTTPVVDANGNAVTPDNWFTDLIGKIQLALTFDPARKAELNERQALANLAEAQKLMKDGNSEAAQLYFNQYADKTAQAQAFLEQIKDPNSETAKTLSAALVKVNSNNIQVLSNLLDKLPPQAAQKLALDVVRSMEKSVTNIQKEEVKAAPETTGTTPVTPALEKQAQVALENLKKSLNQKGNIRIEDQGQQAGGDKPEQVKPEMEQHSQQVTQSQSSQTQVMTQSQPNQAMAAPAEVQKDSTVTQQSERGTENGKTKGGDKENNHVIHGK